MANQDQDQDQAVDPIANFNIICSTIGGFIGLFGLVSFLLKEGFFISEPLVSLAAGVALSPYGLNLVKPAEYVGPSPQDIDRTTLSYTRLVLGVQLVIAGVQLPRKYPKKEWRPLALLLGPGMLGMWIITSGLIWLVIPGMGPVESFIIGACATPTDPVLSNSIVKGSFAEHNIPRPLQDLIVGESGANDGLGYLFLYLPLYLFKHSGQAGGVKEALLSFLTVTVLYDVALSVVYGAVVGWLAKYLLYWSDKNRYVEKESFHFFVVALALFVMGTAGLLDIDDVLACFVAGNAFTWDDWFRQETEDDHLQPIMDFLLGVTIFMWLGAVCPWDHFFNRSNVPWIQLLLLAVLVLIFRRLPVILALKPHIKQIQSIRQGLIVGFFGPIGISAIFYLYTIREFLLEIQRQHPDREDCQVLADVTLVVVWFLVFASVTVHGLAIPLGNLALLAPRLVKYIRALGTDNRRSASAGEGGDESRALLAHHDRHNPA